MFKLTERIGESREPCCALRHVAAGRRQSARNDEPHSPYLVTVSLLGSTSWDCSTRIDADDGEPRADHRSLGRIVGRISNDDAGDVKWTVPRPDATVATERCGHRRL